MRFQGSREWVCRYIEWYNHIVQLGAVFEAILLHFVLAIVCWIYPVLLQFNITCLCSSRSSCDSYVQLWRERVWVTNTCSTALSKKGLDCQTTRSFQYPDVLQLFLSLINFKTELKLNLKSWLNLWSKPQLWKPLIDCVLELLFWTPCEWSFEFVWAVLQFSTRSHQPQWKACHVSLRIIEPEQDSLLKV